MPRIEQKGLDQKIKHTCRMQQDDMYNECEWIKRCKGYNRTDKNRIRHKWNRIEVMSRRE